VFCQNGEERSELTGLPRKAILRALAEGVVYENEGGHRLNHHHGPWQDAGIVTAASGEGGFGAFDRDG
jgi:hypothetical protein